VNTSRMAEPVFTLDGLLHYPFPLASGQVATLLLPPTLDADDADRLGAFILSLVAASPPVSLPDPEQK